MWRMLLPCGKLKGLLLFCLIFLISILFLKPTYLHEMLSRTELARPVMGTLFLVTLHVGLAHAVSPTNTNFRITFLLTRLQEALYENFAV